MDMATTQPQTKWITAVRTPTAFWGVLVGLLIAGALLVLLAPLERTLGSGIRAVYVHVGLTWTGLAAFWAAALLGAIVLLTGAHRVAVWMQTAGWVATGFFGAGVVMSMVASRVNWGAVFLQEPRMAAALNGLAIAVVVQVAIGFFPWPRLRGALALGLPLLLSWLTMRARLVLHPDDPIGTSQAVGIQATFLAMFAICALAAIWIGWHVQQRRSHS